MDRNALDWLFSTAPQALAALVGLIFTGVAFIHGAIDKATPEDTVEWYRLISTVFNNHGIGRAAWSYKQMDFGLSDSRLDSVRSELIRYL